MRSRYRPDAAMDYSHRFHAGNVGDVWKHCVLIEVLRSVAARAARVTYVDTHAGEGLYALGPTGEWSEGVGRLWSDHAAGEEGPVARYVALCRELGSGGARPEKYPGSALFARAVLGADAHCSLWEQDAAAAESLRKSVGSDAGIGVHEGDGLAALAGEVTDAERAGYEVVALIDPPWTQKADWIAVPDALAHTTRTSERACLMLWYPVKSLTRPNAMIARLAAVGVSGVVAELITTSLEHQRQRLNGSGVVLVRPPQGVLESIAAAAPVIGERCATRAAAWSFRMQAWPAAR